MRSEDTGQEVLETGADLTSVLQMLESDEEDEAEQEFTVEISKQELVTAVR